MLEPERRRARRYPFIADAEVADLASGTKSSAKTGDLSSGGCFLDMLDPLSEGTEVRVTIFHADSTFTALGKVVFVFPGMGMGIFFRSVEASQSAALQEWVSVLSRGA